MRIAISKYLDEDHFEVLAASGTHMASVDAYCDIHSFAVFGRMLVAFPRHLHDEAIFEAGSGHSESAFWVRLRALVYDSKGHVALEVVMRSQFSPPNGAEAHFFICCDAAALNRVGAAIQRWAESSTSDNFVYDDKAE